MGELCELDHTGTVSWCRTHKQDAALCAYEGLVPAQELERLKGGTGVAVPERVYAEQWVTFMRVSHGWQASVWYAPPVIDGVKVYRLRIPVPAELLEPVVEAEVLAEREP